eukprot:817671-Prymnesium_polylepis.2
MSASAFAPFSSSEWQCGAFILGGPRPATTSSSGGATPRACGRRRARGVSHHITPARAQAQAQA